MVSTSIDAGLVQALIVLVVFGFGMLVSWLVWLTLQHFNYGRPAYQYLTGDEELDEDGHIRKSSSRFDELDEANSELSGRVDRVHEDVRRVEKRQDTVLSNQKKIADGLGVDLDRPRFYRGSGENTPSEDPTDD